MASPTNKLLDQAKLKKTPARIQILDLLFSTKKPLNAYEIQKNISPQANIATIYRNLEQLKTSHLIHEITSKRGYIACNLATSKNHHGFLICNDCGDIQEFTESHTNCQLSMQTATKQSFQAQEHINEILGLCQKCH